MYNQLMNKINEIVPGFGLRLKEERKRLGLSQSELGQLAGVQRLAQSQYEAETSTPTVRYLCQINAAGVDLSYLLFGVPSNRHTSTSAETRRIEIEAFKLTEDYVRTKYDGDLPAEGRYVIFELIRAQLVDTTGAKPDSINLRQILIDQK